MLVPFEYKTACDQSLLSLACFFTLAFRTKNYILPSSAAVSASEPQTPGSAPKQRID